MTPEMIEAGIEEVRILIKDFTITPEDYVRRIYEVMEAQKHD